MKIRAYLLYLALVMLWGGAFMLIKKGLEDLSPLQIASVRIASGAITLLPVFFYYVRQIPKKAFPILLLSGVLGSLIPSFFYAYAQQYVDSSTAGILSSMTPVFTVLISVILFSYRMNFINVLGLLLCFIASVLLVSTSGGEIRFDQFNPESLLIIAATLCYAINLNILKFKLKEVHPLAIASSALIGPGILSIIFLAIDINFSEYIFHSETHTGLYYIVFLGIFASGMALILFNLLLKIASPFFASSITYMIPVVSMFVGALDNEVFTAEKIFFSVLILAGVFFGNYSGKRPLIKTTN